MSRFFFLPKFFIYGLFVANIYLFFKEIQFIQILIFFMSLAILFLFRRRSVLYQETIKNDGEIYLSPVYGVVESIKSFENSLDQNLSFHEVRVSLSFWQEKGLYLPTSGEISSYHKNIGQKMSKYFLSNSQSSEDVGYSDLTLISKNRNHLKLRFHHPFGGLGPVFWVKSGDRGRGGACFGYYLLGGSLIMNLPFKSEILIFEKEKLIPGQSVIASIKN
jgi:hypothetical protein